MIIFVFSNKRHNNYLERLNEAHKDIKKAWNK